jgi:hypothetical protein
LGIVPETAVAGVRDPIGIGIQCIVFPWTLVASIRNAVQIVIHSIIKTRTDIDIAADAISIFVESRLIAVTAAVGHADDHGRAPRSRET